VLDVLVEYLEDLEVDIHYGISINENSIEHELNEKMEPVFEIKTENLSLNASKIIVTTGGKTYPNTGSTGDGYKIAQSLSHSITDIKPGLVPFRIDDFLLNGLSGLALEDVIVSFKDGKKKTSVKGDILISHFGLTGPAIMDLSSKLLEKSDYDLLSGAKELYTNKISIDFTPDMSEDDIKSMITKDTPNNGKTTVKNYLKKFLPNSFIDYFLMSLNMSSQLTMANLTKKDKNKITDNIKRFPVEIASLEEELAKVTIGGIKSKEIDSKTLESKLVEGLYFAGEVLEVAGPSGGYNLQIAFATGYLAGEEAAKSLKE
jgi:predicted Rossmann fold flavoprotein